jgi:hypothetical protein
MAYLAPAFPELGAALPQLVLNFVVGNICFMKQTWPSNDISFENEMNHYSTTASEASWGAYQTFTGL